MATLERVAFFFFLAASFSRGMLFLPLAAAGEVAAPHDCPTLFCLTVQPPVPQAPY